MTDVRESALNTFEIESQAIANLSNQLSDDFEKVVDLITTNTDRVAVSGMGKSGLIGKKIAATLASTGTPAIFMHPAEAIHGDLGMLTKNDVLIAISCSGETEEMIRLIPLVRRIGIIMVAMAGNTNSTLAREANFFLNVSVESEACPLQLAPTSSSTAALAMGDALAIAIMQVKKFTPQDFAFRHPGGSLGKKLITQVKDVMYTENLPIACQTDSFKNIISIISNGMKGIAVVIEDEKIIGTITDGDIRRAINKYNGECLFLTAKEVMTTKPITISADLMLVEAEKLSRENKIVSLLVVDKLCPDKLVGIVQSHSF